MPFVDYELKHISAIYKPKRVLDIGAGELNQSLELAREGIEVDAIEPSSQQNLELPQNLHLHITTVEQFEYPKDTYDLIVFRMVAQRLQNDFVKNLFERKSSSFCITPSRNFRAFRKISNYINFWFYYICKFLSHFSS